jgi:PHD/YefM family antitoxin component YafN of YafNO toxin-antitoxin module
MIGSIESATLRAHLADTLDEVSKKKDYMLVTRKRQPVSAIISLDLLEDLLAATSHKYLKAIREARKQAKAGKLFTHEQVFGKL